jgi:hypothetical protein
MESGGAFVVYWSVELHSGLGSSVLIRLAVRAGDYPHMDGW